MKANSQLVNRFIQSAILVASAAFLTSPSMAQMAPGGAQTAPSQQTQTSPGSPSGSQPGMPSMGQAANNNQDLNDPAHMLDKAFVRQALQGGMAEVQLGQLALQKSSNPDVKQFAQRMVNDHTKLGDAMKQVAQTMDVKPPSSLSSKDKSTLSKLNALNGDDFDKAYIKDMLKDHKQDEKEFTQEAKNTSNPALQNIVTQGAQIIGQHLQMIEQIAQKNNVVASK